MKTIPVVDSINMANDIDVYHVDINREDAIEWAEDGEYITNFDVWLEFCAHAPVSGYGRASGRKLWQINRETQRQVYRICKANSVEVSV